MEAHPGYQISDRRMPGSDGRRDFDIGGPTLTWQEFARENPELAALGEERLDRNGLVMLATLRKNGWPRISPVEPLFFNGQLYLGMM